MGKVPLDPIAALTAGIVILVRPKTLNYIVAAYLIFVGSSGLMKNLRENPDRTEDGA